MKESILYTDETKIKDLTVGQLKDIILEVLLQNPVSKNITYHYENGYTFKVPLPEHENPHSIPKGPIC